MAALTLPTRAVRAAPATTPTDISLIWQDAIHRYEQLTDLKISSLEPVTNVEGVLRQTRKTASRFRLHRHDNGKLDKLRTVIGKSLGTVEAVGEIVGGAASLVGVAFGLVGVWLIDWIRVGFCAEYGDTFCGVLFAQGMTQNHFSVSYFVRY
ncbi:uncharacterized protein BO80DRAFT_23176 [Aspergillus ibericus CBS 121593]|uniref:Fungal STAND N-terminal Goodbye domain-containing protein n=1 Tax=Aspergillus ibericus CBS 121593 TaxID=1448316 RepID=A0A395H658_9EURO|nr:hypothetical protein BO80DRAFT_23176 [Aspergillus ibericus CBS 121593]RAL03009.1 hypothetical protein BO80DRAFT_23176 [Aspergillus ibericus CBS 121593]